MGLPYGFTELDREGRVRRFSPTPDNPCTERELLGRDYFGDVLASFNVQGVRDVYIGAVARDRAARFAADVWNRSEDVQLRLVVIYDPKLDTGYVLAQAPAPPA